MGLSLILRLRHIPPLDLVYDQEHVPPLYRLLDVLGCREVGASMIEACITEGLKNGLPKVVYARAIGVGYLVHRQQDYLGIIGWRKFDLVLGEPFFGGILV